MLVGWTTLSKHAGFALGACVALLPKPVPLRDILTLLHSAHQVNDAADGAPTFSKTVPRDGLRSNPLQGNVGCHAPELAMELSSAKTERRAAVFDFSAQSSFELGSLAFRIVVGQLPYPRTPHALDTSAPLPLLPGHYPDRFKEVMRGLVHASPSERLTLEAAIAEMADLALHVSPSVGS
jgi:hypothetical protein